MRVNGKEIPLNAPISLQAFLLEQHYDLRTIAVERNEEIVPKATYAEVMLQAVSYTHLTLPTIA